MPLFLLMSFTCGFPFIFFLLICLSYLKSGCFGNTKCTSSVVLIFVLITDCLCNVFFFCWPIIFLLNSFILIGEIWFQFLYQNCSPGNPFQYSQEDWLQINESLFEVGLRNWFLDISVAKGDKDWWWLRRWITVFMFSHVTRFYFWPGAWMYPLSMIQWLFSFHRCGLNYSL